MVWFNNKTSFLPVVPQVSATVNVSTAYLTTRASSEFCATQGMSVFLCCDVVPYIEPEIEMYEWTVEYQGTTTALSSEACIIVNSTDFSDEGYYKCYVTVFNSTISASLYLRVVGELKPLYCLS